jgi:hypothetical protein
LLTAQPLREIHLAPPLSQPGRIGRCQKVSVNQLPQERRRVRMSRAALPLFGMHRALRLGQRGPIDRCRKANVRLCQQAIAR